MGDDNPIRSLFSGSIRWVDPFSWMESMNSKEWNTFIDKETKHWKALCKQKEVQSKILPFAQRIASVSHLASTPLFFAAGNEVCIGALGTLSYHWAWNVHHESNPMNEVADLDAIPGGHIWTVSDVGNGSELYELAYRTRGNSRPHWSHRGVGPFVAVIGKRVYCIESKNTLVYWRLVSWNAKTGKDYRIHYEESNPSVNLSLLRCSTEGAFLLRQAGGFEQLFRITETNKHPIPLTSELESVPCAIVTGDIVSGWFQWKQGKWEPKGGFHGWNFPLQGEWSPESISIRRKICVTRSYGERAIWKLSRTEKPICIWRGLGNVMLDPWGGPMIRILLPGREPQWISFESDVLPTQIRNGPGGVQRYTVKSKDGTHVPYIIVKNTSNAKGLLVIGYSAYGISTGFSTARWQPLLDMGWALCFGMFRGSGDHTPDWAQAGRLTGRIRTIEDAESVVKAAQKQVGCDAKRTFLYGRSAGGLWVGALVARHGTGDLFKGVYMEVPYVDVLRTTSNPSLPLTEIETEEFGRSDLRIRDLVGMIQWSPIDVLQQNYPNGVPRIYQLVRSGENDKEVLSYEPAKWIIRSRGGREEKESRSYFAIEANQGHFSSGWRGVEQQATDLAILEFWLQPHRG